MRMPTVRRDDWIEGGREEWRGCGRAERVDGGEGSRGVKKVVMGGWTRRRLEVADIGADW
jgi:hypothetical protein